MSVRAARAVVVAVVVGLSSFAILVGVSERTALAQKDAGARVRKRLSKGLALFRDLDYRKAIRSLAPVPKDPAATRNQRLRALEVIGLSHLILGENKRAKEAFEDLLAIDPGYQLRDDTGSPKIRNFFDKVKKDYVPGFDARAVAELEHAAPSSASAGRRIELEVYVRSGGKEVKQIIGNLRRRGVLAYMKAVPFRNVGKDRWLARFTAEGSDRDYVLEYYIDATNIAGGSIGRVGGPETPLALNVRAGGAAKPWYGRWYVIAGGAAVIGIGAALVFTAGGGAGDGTLDPGRVTLTP